MLKGIMKYEGKYKKNTILAIVLITLAVMFQVIPGIIACKMITPLVLGETITVEEFFIELIVIAVCLLLNSYLYCLGLAQSHKAAFATLENIRRSMQAKLEKLPLGVIEGKGNGALRRLFVDDVDAMELILAHSIPEGFGNSVVPIVVYVSLFAIDWKLALLTLIPVFIGMIAMGKMMAIGTSGMDKYYSAGKKMNGTIVEFVNGMEVIKVFNKTGENFERYIKHVEEYRDYTLDWYKACWPWMSMFNSIIPCSALVTLPVGIIFVLNGMSTLDDLILVLCLSLGVGIPVLKTLNFVPQFPQLDYKLKQIEQVLDSAVLETNGEDFKGKDYSIKYENVTFAYDEETVVNNVSIEIPENTVTAFIGESGSGKSTLAKLLVHYYDLNSGSIAIGGQKITDMSLEALNEKISYVSQEQFLFNTSILENIRMGKKNATDEEVYQALEKAQCMEFLNKLPNGVKSLAGDSGKMLSGGERQRLSLARALIKDAPIVVLDEATAFMDPENEEKMNAAIDEVVKDKTLVIIAHKLDTIRNADQICLLKEGEIIARGKHDDLLETSEDYKKLWTASVNSTQWTLQNGGNNNDSND